MHNFKRDFVGICGRNQLEWYLTDYACFFYGVVTVSIHTTFGKVLSPSLSLSYGNHMQTSEAPIT